MRIFTLLSSSIHPDFLKRDCEGYFKECFGATFSVSSDWSQRGTTIYLSECRGEIFNQLLSAQGSYLGLDLLDLKGKVIRPTTTFALIYGGRIKKNKLLLSWEKLESLLESHKTIWTGGESQGYKVLFYRDHPLGIGFLKEGTLQSYLSKKFIKSINLRLLQERE